MKTQLYIYGLSSSDASGTARHRRMRIHQFPQGWWAKDVIAKTWALFGDRGMTGRVFAALRNYMTSDGKHRLRYKNI